MACSRGRCPPPQLPPENQQRKTTILSVNCPFEVQIRPGLSRGEPISWCRVINGSHNHVAFGSPQDHSAHRRLTASQRESVAQYAARGLPSNQILLQFQDSQGTPTTLARKRDILNVMATVRREAFNGLLPMDGFLQWLPERRYLLREWRNEENQLVGLFITNPGCISLTKMEGNVIVMDCTYNKNKNRSRTLLLNILGFDSEYQTFTVAWCFLTGEGQQDYTWALQQLKETMAPYEPKVVVLNREQAFMNALAAEFGNSKQLLCLWQIKKDIFANCKPKFSTLEQWAAFESMVQNVINAPTVEEYESNVRAFRHEYSCWNDGNDENDAEEVEGEPKETQAARYVWRTLLKKHKEKFCRAFTSHIRSFGCSITRRVRANNAYIKKFLRSSQSDYNEAFLALAHCTNLQQHELSARQAQQAGKRPSCLITGSEAELYRNVFHKVSIFALMKSWEEFTGASDIIRRSEAVEWPCNCSFFQEWGVPCRHLLVQHRRPCLVPLTIAHFDSKWYPRFHDPYTNIQEATTPNLTNHHNNTQSSHVYELCS